jgi:hypothetical protein
LLDDFFVVLEICGADKTDAIGQRGHAMDADWFLAGEDGKYRVCEGPYFPMCSASFVGLNTPDSGSDLAVVAGKITTQLCFG